MSLRKNIFDHLRGRLLYKIVEVVNVLLLGKLFSEWTLGQYNQFIMQSSFLILLLNFGSQSAAQYFIGKGLLTPMKAYKFSTWVLLASIILLTLFLFLFPLPAGFNFTTQHFLVFIILYALFGIWQEFNYGVCISMKKINLVNNFMLLGPSILLIFYLLYAGGYLPMDLSYIIYFSVANQFFIGLTASYIIWHYGRYHPEQYEKTNLRDFLSFGSIIYITNILQFLVYRFDYWILEDKDIEHFSYYTLASQMISLLWFIPQRVSDISYIYTVENKDLMKQKTSRAISMSWLIQIALGILISIALSIYFWMMNMGNFYQSVQYFLILLIPASLFGVSILFTAYQAGSRRLYINFLGSLTSCILAVLLSLWLIPEYGVWGTLLESALVYIFSFAFQFYYFRLSCPIDFKSILSNLKSDIKEILNEKNFSISKYLPDRKKPE